ncbi:aspartic peptidase domain-containing protein [Lanmaoa asiatica]|nr:aspartic peptidase domain-containing protein [Lanmaoa asiatica]
MKSAPRLWIMLSLAILAGAMPTISDRALRIPLHRRSLNAVDPTLVQSATSERFLGAQRVAQLISHTNEKYKNTLAAYERNTGSRHPLDTLSRFSSTRPSKRASNGTIALNNSQAIMWYGPLTIGTPPQRFTAKLSLSFSLGVPTRGCLRNCYGHRVYDASKSSTSRCSTFPPFFLLVYGSGQVAGIKYDEEVKVGGYEIANQGFGGAIILSTDFGNGYAADGLSGLAFPNISDLSMPPLMQNLNESGQLPQRFFSFKLSTTTGQSELIIGGADNAAFKNDTLVSVPVTKQAYWQVELGRISRPSNPVPESIGAPAVIDTGTTLILVSSTIANSYYSGISGAKCGPDGICTVPCDTIASTTPTLTFGGREFPVSADTWNLGPVEPGSTDCMAGMGTANFGMWTLLMCVAAIWSPFVLIEFAIIGDVFLQNVYTIFDFGDPPRVHFADLV